MGKTKDISPRKRARIEVLLKSTNKTQSEVSRIVGVSVSYVNRFAKKLNEQKGTSPQRKGKCGRKRATTEVLDRLLIRKARQNRHLTSTQIQRIAQELGAEITARTVRRRLFEHDLKARRPRNKQKLTPAMTKKRLQWAKLYQNWTIQQWSKVSR